MYICVKFYLKILKTNKATAKEPFNGQASSLLKKIIFSTARFFPVSKWVENMTWKM